MEDCEPTLEYSPDKCQAPADNFPCKNNTKHTSHSSLLSVTVINTMTQSNLGEGAVFSAYASETEGSLDRTEIERKSAPSWPTPRLTAFWLSYTVQGCLPREGAAHSGCGPQTSIINHDSLSQIRPQTCGI